MKGKNVSVHYVGVAWSNGQEFDASWNRGEAFEFRLGAGQVIQGWDDGVAGMKVGGRRQLTIPPDMGYGSRGAICVIKLKATEKLSNWKCPMSAFDSSFQFVIKSF